MKQGRYDDIIHLSRPISQKHKPMSREERAAQFSPFAALRGFDEEIEKTILKGDEEAQYWDEVFDE